MSPLIFRPLGPWLDWETENRRSALSFKVGWEETVELLVEEVDHLDGGAIIIQVDAHPDDIRRDGGGLLARASVKFPGVRVSFNSSRGPLTFVTDAYEDFYGDASLTSWQANVRAIALSLKALRAVDRYGVTGRGEQYRGFVELDSRPAEMTWQQAAGFIAIWAEPDSDERRAVVETSLLAGSTEALTAAYRSAARRLHPDLRDGDAELMTRLNVARDLLSSHHRGS